MSNAFWSFWNQDFQNVLIRVIDHGPWIYGNSTNTLGDEIRNLTNHIKVAFNHIFQIPEKLLKSMLVMNGHFQARKLKKVY